MANVASFQGHTWDATAPTDTGTACPHCGRLMRTYRRSLSSSMAFALITLYRLQQKQTRRRYMHVREFDRGDGRGEVGKLALWGLVKEAPNDDTAKRTSGMWSTTQFGRDFVVGIELVPKYILLSYGSSVRGFAGPPVAITDCLGTRFNYQELMAR